jgi:hypothetical protein
LNASPLGAAIERQGPAAALETLGAARVLDHAVERHELRHDEVSHLSPPIR